MKLPSVFLFLLFFSLPALADSKVVVTIKPLHSLVAAVMAGDPNQPLLLVDGKASLHDFALKPSQVKALQNAAVVFYIGDDFELFMRKTLRTLPESMQRAPMVGLQGITPIRLRWQDGFEAHEEASEDHKKTPNDLHIWMSPQNAKVMLREIARQLVIVFPDKKDIYFANVKRIATRLDALDTNMRQRMSKFSYRPFVTFHDATQYFESLYNLNSVGSVTAHPEHGLSARRVSELRERIKKSSAVCVLREPQFDGKAVDTIIEGTGARSGVLDAEGALLAPGPELYFQLIEGVASTLETCLAP